VEERVGQGCEGGRGGAVGEMRGGGVGEDDVVGGGL